MKSRLEKIQICAQLVKHPNCDSIVRSEDTFGYNPYQNKEQAFDLLNWLAMSGKITFDYSKKVVRFESFKYYLNKPAVVESTISILNPDYLNSFIVECVVVLKEHNDIR